MRILGIETSCDETAAAVVEITERRSNETTKQPVVQSFRCSVLSNIIASQIKIHAKTGGVVPEVAARAHVEKIIPVIERAIKGLRNEEIKKKQTTQSLSRLVAWSSSIDAIAVTAGPGLATSLLVGVEVARTLSWLWKKPVVAVNHLAGHVYANFLGEKIRSIEHRAYSIEQNPTHYALSPMQFPALALIVSGGHTELVLMRGHLDFKIVGETRDDAAGEAFDKVAKMLNLGYPGGPAISREAEKWYEGTKVRRYAGNKPTYLTTYVPNHLTFPRPMIDSPDFDFSFSGLKTAVLYWLRAQSIEHRAKLYALSPKLLASLCYAFQEAVVDVLVSKTIRAAKKYKVKTVLLGGGVAANARLRQRLVEAIKRHTPSALCSMPSVAYATDNAAMIAVAGYFMAQAKQFTPTPKRGKRRPLVWGFTPWQKLDVDPNWELGQKFSPLPR
ncbi:tRNA (adenosine(37)-N6)-threonylcarbamoyltransferase complex transferase subunit TsaD [Candidatus Uhrbacteria bacterium]|nr:tRNA (adenosine(37)-N6)-threonylcarbamoyltransferase complex transferase subunit TsaD [Candidatus Uhrbacteria bacterium]